MSRYAADHGGTEPHGGSQTWTLSEFLNLLEVRGRSWCIVEIHGSGGFSVPPNDGVVFHTLLEGTARIAGVSGGTMELVPGDLRIVLSGEAHAVRTHADSPARTLDFLREDDHDIDAPPTVVIGTGPVTARILCARLKADWPGDLRRLTIPAVVSLDPTNSSPAAMTMRVQTMETCSRGSGAAALLTRMSQVTLTLGLRNHPACPALFRLSATRDPIAHAMQLIGADPSAEWSVASLAQKVGMGRSNFAARFTTEIGRTPMDVITEQRMRFAAELLRQSELKIAEISARAGYSSEAAFSRRFTRFFGLPPGRMRQDAQRARSVVARPAARHA